MLSFVLCVCVFVMGVLGKFTVCDRNKPGAAGPQQGKYMLLLFVVTSFPLGIEIALLFLSLVPFSFL